MSLAIKRSSTAPKKREWHLPFGHVTTARLKREVEAGIDYFWSRRPAAMRPPVTSYLDFKQDPR